MASSLLSPALGPPSDDEIDGETDTINEEEYRNIDSPRYHVDPDGDLVLKITDHAKHTHLFSTVSREALIRASKIFRNLADKDSPTNTILPSGYTSPHHDSDPVVTKDLLHVEDDFASLIAILASIHKNTTLVPQNVSYDQLLNLAITCDKYEISTRFLKSANKYIDSVTSGGNSQTITDGGRENLIFIADVFNREALAQRLCERLADTIELPGARGGGGGGGAGAGGGKQEYTRYHSDECNLDRIPQPYIDAILLHRKTQLSFIFDQVKAYERFLSQQSPSANLTTRFLTVYTTYPTSEISEFLEMLKGCNVNCGAAMYGSFVRQLKTAGLANYIVCDEDCSNWPWSVERALSIIHGLDFMHGDKECYLAKETEVEEGRRAFVNCPYYHVSRHRRIFRSRQRLEIPFKSTTK